MSDLAHEYEGIEYALFQSQTLPLSPFGAAAESIWRLGYSVLPLMPREKRPIIGGWQEYCARLPTIHEMWKLVGQYRHVAQGGWKESFWRGLPNIGIACGLPVDADHILIAIDVDFDDERLLGAVPQSTMAKCSTNHGETRFF